MRQLDEQRYLWIFRILITLFVISFVSNMVLFLSFGNISPTPKLEAFFVSEIDKKVNSIVVKRISDLADHYDIQQDSIGYEIAKYYISNYITDRETLYSSSSTMQKLWGVNGNLYNFSKRKLYTDFIESNEYKQSLINRDKLVKTINIKTLNFQPVSKIWTANIEVKTTTNDGLNPVFSEKNIKITASFIKDNILKKNPVNKWINPLGFKINSYEYF